MATTKKPATETDPNPQPEPGDSNKRAVRREDEKPAKNGKKDKDDK